MVEQADMVRNIGYWIIGFGLLLQLIGMVARQITIFVIGFIPVLLGSIVASASHLILGAGIGPFLLGVIVGPIWVYIMAGFLLGTVLMGGCFTGLFPDSVCRRT